jgi:predicted Zn-dependent peptidase
MARKAKTKKRSRSQSGSDIERHRLPNGLCVLLVPLPHAQSAAVTLYVRVGSRYETARDNGISHFLEHMLHRGTASHPSAHEQALAFERLGGTLGASTYVDHGVLTVSVPPDRVLSVIELLSEVCRAPLFDAIEIERGIVREEILESLDARGKKVGPDDLLREAAFPGHALGFPIAGSLATLSRFTRAALRRHHQRHYTTDLVVTVSGRFSRQGLLEHVGRCFDLPRARPPSSRPPRPLGGPVIRHVADATSQTALRLAFRAPGEHDPDEAATELLLRVIDDGTSTRLYHRVCDERGLCYDVSALYESYQDVGLMDFAADCSHENTPEVLGEILAMARDLAVHGPRDDELEKARDRLRFQLAAMRDSPAELGAFYGFSELAGLSRTPEARIRELDAVPRQAVQRAAARLFRADRLALVTVGETSRALKQRVVRSVSALA